MILELLKSKEKKKQFSRSPSAYSDMTLHIPLVQFRRDKFTHYAELPGKMFACWDYGSRILDLRFTQQSCVWFMQVDYASIEDLRVHDTKIPVNKYGVSCPRDASECAGLAHVVVIEFNIAKRGITPRFHFTVPFSSKSPRTACRTIGEFTVDESDQRARRKGAPKMPSSSRLMQDICPRRSSKVECCFTLRRV